MTWTDLLISGIDETYKATDQLMAMVGDDELDWKPASGSNWMTTGQLLMHLTNACGLCCQGFVTGDWGLPEGMDMQDLPPDAMLPPAEKLPAVESVADARRLLAADMELALRMVDEAGEDRLDNEMLRAPWASPECADQRLGQHLLGMIEHLATHKAQLFYYLKLQGKDVNTMHLWGM
ncbi:DinB family protein [bacterium]|nr:DinB family protein [bacterium]